MQTPALENTITEELPAEPSSSELPEDFMLPEPPVGVEASGSGTSDLEDLIQPTISSEGQNNPSHAVTDDAHIYADVISEDETKGNDFAAPPATADVVTQEKNHPAEDVVNEVKIPAELEISTFEAKTIDDQGPPVLLTVPPEVADKVSEASQPDIAETGHLPDDVSPSAEEINIEQPEEDAAINVVVSISEPSDVGEDSVFEEGGLGQTTKTVLPEVTVDLETHETPAVMKEATEAPEISTDDLREDEILLVNEEEPEPAVTTSLSPAQPTTLSPESESPFTLNADVNPASEGQPDIIFPSLEEVRTKQEHLNV